MSETNGNKSVIIRRYQTTVPRKIREKLNIEIGDVLEWEIPVNEKGTAKVHKLLQIRESEYNESDQENNGEGQTTPQSNPISPQTEKKDQIGEMEKNV